MLDGFNAIITYIVQYPDVAHIFHEFLYDYVLGFWFVRIRPEGFTVHNMDIRTNNFLESFHAALLKYVKPHPKIWEFIDQLRFIENQNVIEFNQISRNIKIRINMSENVREANTLAIREAMEQLNLDHTENRIETFLRKTGHRVDGYISQQII